MPQERRAPRSSQRIRLLSKRATDIASIFLGATGINCRPYPVITPGSKDTFAGLFGTCRKRFSHAPEGCTKAEIDSDFAVMRAQLPKPAMNNTPKAEQTNNFNAPKPPIKVTQPSKTTGVLKFVRPASPACTKRVRVILRISASGNRITKNPPTSTKRKSLDIRRTLASIQDFKMPATLNRPKPLNALRTSSAETPKVNESQPHLRRSPRAKNSQKPSP
ncbi:hypothetical protein HOY80DRAFT_1097482 [Tuber brumale]|nr:hypothetical protein HOY80DRAFT_1097482 [Tuber brumale]